MMKDECRTGLTQRRNEEKGSRKHEMAKTRKASVGRADNSLPVRFPSISWFRSFVISWLPNVHARVSEINAFLSLPLVLCVLAPLREVLQCVSCFGI
jgi:hypothetical protein